MFLLQTLVFCLEDITKLFLSQIDRRRKLSRFDYFHSEVTSEATESKYIKRIFVLLLQIGGLIAETFPSSLTSGFVRPEHCLDDVFVSSDFRDACGRHGLLVILFRGTFVSQHAVEDHTTVGQTSTQYFCIGLGLGDIARGSHHTMSLAGVFRDILGFLRGNNTSRTLTGFTGFMDTTLSRTFDPVDLGFAYTQQLESNFANKYRLLIVETMIAYPNVDSEYQKVDAFRTIDTISLDCARFLFTCMRVRMFTCVLFKS